MAEGRARGGQVPGPGQARAGGGCVSIPEARALSEVLRSLSGNPQLSQDQQREFEPRLALLQQLTDDYDNALSNPSIADTLREEILRRVKTKDVKERVGPILQGLFDGTPGGRITQDIMDHILNCILDALTNDLPLTTLMSMVCMMFIKAFYDDSPVRMGLGAAFVGSVGYLTWVGGMNQIFGLGRESVILILSAMAQCAHITEDVLYSQTLKKLIGEDLFNGIEGSIKYLSPSACGIFAMSNVYLMGLIYDPGNFPAGDDLLTAEAERAAAAAAAAAAGGGGAQEPLQPGPPPNIPAPADAVAAAAAAAAVPGNSVFRQMYHELKGAAVVVGTHAKNHLVTLGGLARRIESTRPGQVGGDAPENKLYNLANVFFQACVSKTFTVFNEQAGRAGLSAVDVSAKHLLSACLPSEIRTGGELEAREEIFILAHRIKSNVIDCLEAIPPRMTRVQATSYLEEAFPVFSSHLTVENVDRFTASQLSGILSALIKAARTVDFPEAGGGEESGSQEGSQESTKVVPPPTPLHVRLAVIDPAFNETLRLFQGVFRTPEEANKLKDWSKRHVSYFDQMLGCFDVMIGTFAQKARHNQVLQSLGANAANATRDIVNQWSVGVVNEADIAVRRRFPQLSVNLPTPERFLTSAWIHVLNDINRMTEQGMSYENIVTAISREYNISSPTEFNAYIKALILRLNLEFLINRGGDCSVQPAIIPAGQDENRKVKYRAVLVLNLPERFRISNGGDLLENIHLPMECFKDDVVVPGQASALLQKTKGAMETAAVTAATKFSAAKNAASSWLSSFSGMRRCVQAQGPPAAEPPVPPEVLVQNILNPAEKEIEEVIKAAETRAETRAEPGAKIVDCVNASLLLEHLENANEILSTSAAMVGFVSEENAQKVIDDEALEALSALVAEEAGQEAARQEAAMQEAAMQEAAGQEAEAEADRQQAVAEAELASAKSRAKSRAKDLQNRGFGGKSRNRRRPATAKRTRRKAYNKKSNKRKSRKQISRRRQSRRK